MGHQATTFAATDGARWRRCPRRAMDAARAPSWAGSMSLEDEVGLSQDQTWWISQANMVDVTSKT